MLSRQIKVLLVDHQALLRESVGAVLERERDLTVVGCVDVGDRAVDLAVKTQPHVTILDADRPEEVVETFTKLRQASEGSRFLVLSSHDHPALLQELLALGISGYLVKTVTVLELMTAIRTV